LPLLQAPTFRRYVVWLERLYENLNRRGFPEGADCDSFLLRGSDHVSTFTEGASCAVSTVYRGRLERASGSVAPEVLAGDRRAVGAGNPDV
jgi:hypothetical protein